MASRTGSAPNAVSTAKAEGNTQHEARAQGLQIAHQSQGSDSGLPQPCHTDDDL